MDLININSISMSRALLIFYVIIASQFTSGLMGKQMRTFLEESRLAQHMIGFILMLVLVMMVGNVNNIGDGLIYSLIGYAWFILTTKLDIQWNLIIIMMLFVGYVYETKMINKEHDVQNDKVLTGVEKDNVVANTHNTKMYVAIGIIIVTIMGTVLYASKKQEQYGGGFSAVNFFLY